jgi:hypothetical protein
MTPVGGRGSVRPQLGCNTRSIPSQIGCVLNTRILQLPQQNMKIVFDEYLPKWNYRAVPECT